MSDRIALIHPRPLLTPRTGVVVGLAAALAVFTVAVALLHAAPLPVLKGGGFNPLYAASGFLVGGLVGLTGVGGGALMTPLLVLLFGFHPSSAVGADLLYASVTKGVGAGVHGASRTVDWRITGLMALGSVPAAAATVALLYALHLREEASSRLISGVLGAMLVLSAVTLVLRSRILDFAQRHALEPGPRITAALTVALGAVLGTLITLSSVGAGAVGVTVLVLLYPRMPVARIVGSDIAHAVPLTLIAGVGHWLLGTVDLALVGSLLVGSIPGIVLSSLVASRVAEGVLRPLLAATLLLVGARMAF